MKKQPDISSLAEKWLNGTITEAEKKELEDWYNLQPGRDMYWQKNETEEELKTRLFGSIVSQLEIKRPTVYSIHWKRKLSIAASIALIAGGAVFYLISSKESAEPKLAVNAPKMAAAAIHKTATLTLADGTIIPLDSLKEVMQGHAAIRKQPGGQIVYQNGGAQEAGLYNTLTTPRGSAIVKVVLADGSQVWLNAESSLRYPVGFANKRNVQVTGEAYFEVSKDAARQFLVDAEGVTTQVLGTSFNLNTYGKQQGILITLLKGAVKVSNSSTAQLLQPGQQANAKTSGNIRLHKTPDTEAVIAWKEGQLKLNRSDIYTVMKQLERWYDVDILVENGMENRLFSGVISRNSDLITVLNMLSMTQEFSFKRDGNTIKVFPYQ